jgi:hypothetical protein
MFESTVSVQIEASVDQVYRRLKDFTRHSEFSGGLARIEQLSGGPIGVGTRFRAQETVPGRYVSYAEIRALQEPHVIAWKAWVAGVMRTEWEFRLTPTANGTRLVQVSCWEPAGLLGHLMLNLHRKLNAPRENQRTLDRIKSVLEAEAAAEPMRVAQ